MAQVDYARMHGYELHFSASNIEANATVSVVMLLRLFRSSCVQMLLPKYGVCFAHCLKLHRA